MCDEFFAAYPIRNKYEYYLPEIQLFNSDNIGRLNLKDIHIYTEASYYDGHSDDHRFNTFHCNNVVDHDIAWVVGLELVSLLRGLVTIFYGENQQKLIFLDKMKVNGESIEYPNYRIGNNVNIPLDLYKKIGENLITNLTYSERKAYRENAKQNVFNSSLYLAQTHVGLYLILKYFSEPLTWVSLYKIMETFMTLEKYHDKEWEITYNKKDKDRFTNPANNFSMIGIDSRHGFKPDSLKPNNAPKMELKEAKKMFVECAQSYLNFKLEELRKAP